MSSVVYCIIYLMLNSAEFREFSPDAEDRCKHHWVLESPNGATSEGKCRKCDEVRKFRNSMDDWNSWERDVKGFSERLGNPENILGRVASRDILGRFSDD